VSNTLLIPARIEKDLSSLPREVLLQVDAQIMKLRDNPRPHGCEKLKGRDGWRIRVGNYRIVYEIDDRRRTIAVLHVRHRKDVYR
jgi:mRNA interferase RelE/StbE